MFRWLLAIYVSVVLWLAVALGNVALFAVSPADHWPVLETIEGLQTASLIPIALVLHGINHRSRQSALVTVCGHPGNAARRCRQLRLRKRVADIRERPDRCTRQHPRAGWDMRLVLHRKRPGLARPGFAEKIGSARHGRRDYRHPSVSGLVAGAGRNPEASGPSHVRISVIEGILLPIVHKGASGPGMLVRSAVHEPMTDVFERV